MTNNKPHLNDRDLKHLDQMVQDAIRKRISEQKDCKKNINYSKEER